MANGGALQGLAARRWRPPNDPIRIHTRAGGGMTKQEMAAILWKYGKLYPRAFPLALNQAEQLYRQDRIVRGVEE